MYKRYKIAHKSVCLFIEHDCFTKAAAIAFYAFFSFVPVLFLITALAGFIFGRDAKLLDTVLEATKEGVPYISDGVVSSLTGLVDNWKAIGWFGLIALLIASERVFHAVEDSLYSIFHIGRGHGRGYLFRRLIGVAVLLIGLVLALASVGIAVLYGLIESADLTTHGIGYVIDPTRDFAFRRLFPLILVVGGTAAAYKIVGGKMVTLLSAFYGSVIFTVLWEAAKLFFTWYIANFNSYNKLYGPLGALMLLLLWIFYSACIFLFGASVTAAHAEHRGTGAANPNSAIVISSVR